MSIESFENGPFSADREDFYLGDDIGSFEPEQPDFTYGQSDEFGTRAWHGESETYPTAQAFVEGEGLLDKEGIPHQGDWRSTYSNPVTEAIAENPITNIFTDAKGMLRQGGGPTGWDVASLGLSLIPIAGPTVSRAAGRVGRGLNNWADKNWESLSVANYNSLAARVARSLYFGRGQRLAEKNEIAGWRRFSDSAEDFKNEMAYLDRDFQERKARVDAAREQLWANLGKKGIGTGKRPTAEQAERLRLNAEKLKAQNPEKWAAVNKMWEEKTGLLSKEKGMLRQVDFGENRKIREFGLKLIRENQQEAARELHKAANVFGKDIDADRVIKVIRQKFNIDPNVVPLKSGAPTPVIEPKAGIKWGGKVQEDPYFYLSVQEHAPIIFKGTKLADEALRLNPNAILREPKDVKMIPADQFYSMNTKMQDRLLKNADLSRLDIQTIHWVNEGRALHEALASVAAKYGNAKMALEARAKIEVWDRAINLLSEKDLIRLGLSKTGISEAVKKGFHEVQKLSLKPAHLDMSDMAWAKMIEGKSLSEVQKLARELTLRIVD